MHRSPTSHRALRLGLAILAVALFAAAGSNAALAKTKSCADQVIADWYDDGRVGKIYPLHCYREAIAKLPPDVLDYSNAKEEIGRALAFAKQGKPDPGGQDPTPNTTSKGTTKTGTAKTSTTKTGTNKTGTTKTSTTFTDTTDTSGPSSVPVPLLVLGGLAVLLLAAGSAGYLRRRLNGDEEGDDTPPDGTSEVDGDDTPAAGSDSEGDDTPPDSTSEVDGDDTPPAGSDSEGDDTPPAETWR